MPKTLTPRLWVVLWGDAHVNALDESDPQDTVHRPWYYTSVGHLVKSNEEGVQLATDQGEDGKYRTRTFILRSMVMDEWEVPFKKKLPRKKRVKPLPAPSEEITKA